MLVFTALSVSFLVVSFAHPSRAQVPGPGEAGSGQQTSGPTPLFGLRPGLYGKTTLEKGHFQYAVRPNAHVDDSVQVINFTSETQRFELYPADMEQSSSGTLAPKQQDDKMLSVGKWLTIDRSEVTLGPRGRTTFGLHLDIPPFAAPGDHLGAVVASTKTSAQPGSLAVESRVALQVHVRIPGVAKLDAAVGHLRASKGGGGRAFTVDVKNTGNLLLTIKGRVDVRSGDATVAAVPLGPRSIYIIPGGRARFEAAWTGTPLFGTRTAQAIFALQADEERPETRRSDVVTLSFLSWFAIAAVVLLFFVGAIVLLGWWLRRRQFEDESFEHWDDEHRLIESTTSERQSEPSEPYSPF